MIGSRNEGTDAFDVLRPTPYPLFHYLLGSFGFEASRLPLWKPSKKLVLGKGGGFVLIDQLGRVLVNHFLNDPDLPEELNYILLNHI